MFIPIFEIVCYQFQNEFVMVVERLINVLIVSCPKKQQFF